MTRERFEDRINRRTKLFLGFIRVTVAIMTFLFVYSWWNTIP